MVISQFVPSPFRPARWLPGRHLQTLGARLLRRRGGVRLWRERIELPDGDFVDLDFAVDPARLARDGQRPIVIIVHGLEGSARSKYALEAYRALGRLGIAGVGLNFRSCSGELNRLPRLYHSGDTGDIGFVVRLLGQRYPENRKGAIGFSLGGNALLKHLGEKGEAIRPHLDAAAAVSVPYDLAAGADYLDRPSGRIYTWYLLRKLQRKVRAKLDILPPEVNTERALAARTFREFDDAATAPLHQFDGADDYYRRSSSRSFIAEIAIPTFLIHAADDPFQPAEHVPVDAARDNPNVVVALTRSGGHVGFVARGTPWNPAFWGEREVARFMGEMFAG
jgi:predicted alpha/beta-fold hydrolase